MTTITLSSIGIIETPFNETDGMPIQPLGAFNIVGRIILKDEYVAGLADLDGFSHIILIYHFHKIKGYQLSVVPFMDDKPHGIFATRAPKRPNAIGISIVRLVKIDGNVLEIQDVDILNQTPLLDIKPFFPKYDNRENVRFGWLEGKNNIDISKIKSDKRFNDKNPGINRCTR